MRRTYRTLNDYEMQHNAEVGLFTKPSSLPHTQGVKHEAVVKLPRMLHNTADAVKSACEMFGLVGFSPITPHHHINLQGHLEFPDPFHYLFDKIFHGCKLFLRDFENDFIMHREEHCGP